ncbi:MAG TPA: DivIVA domain-containing protein [Longimicrobiales bacterium]|nr:DivIVA domain-containing protein [Longimicrobiales bacterium]
MIDLTPIDVRKKKGDFKRAVRGYDTDLVDDFLDLVAERLEELVKQNMALTDRLARIEEQVGEYRQRDRALTEALVTAQEVREEVRRQAAKDAELLHREAEADAANIRAEAAASREREEENLRRLRARRLHMIQSFRTFLERELNELSVTQEALELEEPLDSGTRAEERAQAQAQEQAKGKAATKRRPPSAMEEPMVEERAAEAESQPRPPESSAAPASGATADEESPDWLSSIMEEKP